MPPKCTQCGAVVAVDATVCPYCQAATALGVARRQRAEEEERARAAAAAMAREHEARAGRAAVDKAARSSLLWGIGALFFCCVPGPQIMAIVRSFHARALAKEHGAKVPWEATAGLVIGTLSIAVGAVAITFAILDDGRLKTENDARMATIVPVAEGATAATLSSNVACAVAEVYLRTHGYEKIRGHRVHSFECNGRLTASDDRAELEDVRFGESTKKHELRACFKRGERWYIERLTTGTCGEVGGHGSSVVTDDARDAGKPPRRDAGRAQPR